MKRFLALLAAALLVPAVATAQADAATTRQLSVGGYIGYETDDADGLTLRLDGEMPFQALSPKINLSWVGSISYSRLSIEDFDYNVFRLIPAARFTMPVNEQLSLYGDAGLGLYHARFKYEYTDFEWVGPGLFDYAEVSREVSDSTTGLAMRLGVGGFFQVSPTMRIGAELDLIPHFGDYDQTSFNILVGAMFSL